MKYPGKSNSRGKRVILTHILSVQFIVPGKLRCQKPETGGHFSFTIKSRETWVGYCAHLTIFIFTISQMALDLWSWQLTLFIRPLREASSSMMTSLPPQGGNHVCAFLTPPLLLHSFPTVECFNEKRKIGIHFLILFTLVFFFLILTDA